MAIAVSIAAQGKTASNVTSLATGTFGTSPSAGDAVVVVVGTLGAASSTHTAPTDSAGHTATAIGSQSSQGSVHLGQLSTWIFENLTTGTGLGSYVVTAHWGSASGTVIALRVTGQKTPTSYNGDIVVNSLTTMTSGTNPSVGPTSPAPAANSLFVGVVTSDSAGDNAYTDGTNVAWTHITNETQPINSTFDDLFVEHFIATGGSTTAQTAQWTGASNFWFGRVFSLAPAVAGAAFLPAPNQTILQAVKRASYW